MGLFQKKPDPLDQRAKTLNRRIAELEAEIAKLNHTLKTPEDAPTGAGSATGTSATRPSGGASSTSGAGSARPAARASGSPNGSEPSHPAAGEPIFERMPPRRLDPRAPEAGGQEAVVMGLRRPVWSQWWRRLKGQLVDPPPANAKLVNYLAAGGIQGLRPLRYERRVARNRIIFICVVLGLVLWGVLIVFWQTQ